MAPPLTLTFSGSRPSSRMTAIDWLANASLSSIRSRSSISQTRALERLARRRDGAQAHHGWIDASDRRRDHAGHGLQPLTLGERALDDDRRAGAVVDAAAVAGCDRAALAKGGAQLGQRLDAGVGTRVLVALESDRLTLGLGDHDRHDLVAEATGLDCRDCARWLRSANSSCSARVTPCRSATFSPVSPIEYG